ncbi:histone-lysine N-methyltransferase SETMAR [Nephila pilipes]|uniref:Histone-lysine N-methyltransferase SETMAR n=1 Tax=Nephila pilipes TaxID=299642 RepID=A0A8X6MVC6_NEPPI|nr:histone-lysine N-methyltransferase SETMAR [Nephila pilipes]
MEASGRPSSSRTDINTARVEEIIQRDRRETVREIASELDLSYGNIQRIVTDATKVCARSVPQVVTSTFCSADSCTFSRPLSPTESVANYQSCILENLFRDLLSYLCRETVSLSFGALFKRTPLLSATWAFPGQTHSRSTKNGFSRRKLIPF